MAANDEAAQNRRRRRSDGRNNSGEGDEPLSAEEAGMPSASDDEYEPNEPLTSPPPLEKRDDPPPPTIIPMRRDGGPMLGSFTNPTDALPRPAAFSGTPDLKDAVSRVQQSLTQSQQPLPPQPGASPQPPLQPPARPGGSPPASTIPAQQLAWMPNASPAPQTPSAQPAAMPQRVAPQPEPGSAQQQTGWPQVPGPARPDQTAIQQRQPGGQQQQPGSQQAPGQQHWPSPQQQIPPGTPQQAPSQQMPPGSPQWGPAQQPMPSGGPQQVPPQQPMPSGGPQQVPPQQPMLSGSPQQVPPQQQMPSGSPQQVPPQQQMPSGSPQQVPPQQQMPSGSPQQVPPQQQMPPGSPQQAAPQQQMPSGSPQQVPPQQQMPPGSPQQVAPQQQMPPGSLQQVPPQMPPGSPQQVPPQQQMPTGSPQQAPLQQQMPSRAPQQTPPQQQMQPSAPQWAPSQQMPPGSPQQVPQQQTPPSSPQWIPAQQQMPPQPQFPPQQRPPAHPPQPGQPPMGAAATGQTQSPAQPAQPMSIQQKPGAAANQASAPAPQPQGAWEYAAPSAPTQPPGNDTTSGGSKGNQLGTKTLELPAFGPVDGWDEPEHREQLPPTASQTKLQVEKRFDGENLSWDEPGRHRKVSDALGTGSGIQILPAEPSNRAPQGEPTMTGVQGEPANLGSQLEQAASLLNQARNKEVAGDWSYRIEDEQEENKGPDSSDVAANADANALAELATKTGERERQESHTELPNARQPEDLFSTNGSGNQPKITIVQSNRTVNEREPIYPDFNPDLTPKMPLRAIPPSEKLLSDTGPRPKLPDNSQWSVPASDQETHIKLPTEGVGFNEKLARLEEEAKSEKFNENTRGGLPSLRSLLPSSRKDEKPQTKSASEAPAEQTVSLPVTPPPGVPEQKERGEAGTRELMKSVDLSSQLPVLPPETKFLDPSRNTTSDVHKQAEETGFFGVTGASPSARWASPRPSASQSLPAQTPPQPSAAQPPFPLGELPAFPPPAPPLPSNQPPPELFQSSQPQSPPTTPQFQPPQPQSSAPNLSPFVPSGTAAPAPKAANLSPFGTGAPSYDEDGNASFGSRADLPRASSPSSTPAAPGKADEQSAERQWGAVSGDKRRKEPTYGTLPKTTMPANQSADSIASSETSPTEQKARVIVPAAPTDKATPAMRTGQGMPAAGSADLQSKDKRSARDGRAGDATTSDGNADAVASHKATDDARTPRDPNLANRYAHLLQGSAADLPQQKRAGIGALKWVIAVCALVLFVGVGALVYNVGLSMLHAKPGTIDISKIGSAGGNAAELADTAMRQGRWTEAMEHYDEAIAADPSNAELYHYRGNCAYALQQYRQASDDYDNALRLDPDSTGILLDRAAALVWQKEYSKAIIDYAKIIHQESNNRQAYFGRALAYSRLGQYAKALPDLKKATAIDPSYADAFRDLSAIYFSLGDYTQSLRAADQALRLQPNSSIAYFTKATALRKLGRKSEAEKAYSASLRIMPGRPDCFNDRGFTDSELGNKAQAITDFMSALEIDPQFAMAANNLKAVGTATLNKLGKSTDAHDMATAALAALALGQTPKATELANRAVEMKPKDSFCLQVQGQCQMAAKQFTQAAQTEGEAIAAAPGNLDAYYFRARANLHDKKFQDAADDYTAYIDRAEKSTEPGVSDHIASAHLERAVAWNALGQGLKAAADGHKYLALSGWKYPNSGIAALLEWLGFGLDSHRTDATKELDDAAAHLPPDMWPSPVVSFLRRIGSESDVMSAAASNDAYMTDAHTWLGFNAQLEGQPNQAADHFNWVKEHGTSDSLTGILASSKWSK